MDERTALLYLSETTLQGLGLTAVEVIESIEHLIRGRSRARVWNAPKSVIQPPDGRYMMAALSAADDPPFLAVKSAILNPRNRERGLPDINAVVTLLDSDTGLPTAIMDGNWITAVRTAGLSGVAAKRLARPDASIAAFIGCGVQARSHLDMFAALFPLKEIHAFGRGATNRDGLCRTAEQLGLRAVASSTAREAMRDAVPRRPLAAARRLCHGDGPGGAMDSRRNARLRSDRHRRPRTGSADAEAPGRPGARGGRSHGTGEWRHRRASLGSRHDRVRLSRAGPWRPGAGGPRLPARPPVG